MPERSRNIFLHGLFITLRRFPAVLWIYAFNFGLALLFSLRLHAQLASIMNNSLHAQRLTNAFDLSILGDLSLRFQDTPDAGRTTNYSSIPVYLAIYFILVPGTLFCYQTRTRARLSTLLHQGVLHFWRFVRITLLTALVSAIILGPLLFLQNKWAEHVDRHAVGLHAFLAIQTGHVLIFLVASVLRLYFDLVEVYTVQLGLRIRRNGRPDRRVRRTLSPAWRTLRAHFSQAWPIFLFLTILGSAAVILSAQIYLHMLAQPRVWPTFVLAQIGLFLMLFTRFWQRGAETSLAMQDPLYPPPQLPIRHVAPWNDPVAPPPAPANGDPTHTSPSDPIPNPEPISPSLDEPDPGVFHHNPTKPAQ